MSLITVSACDAAEYHGNLTPSYALAFINKRVTTSEGIVLEPGSERRPEFGQRFDVSLVGTSIRTATGDLYSTTDCSDPTAFYTVIVFDANGRKITTLFNRLRVPTTPNPTTWNLLRIYSSSVPQRYVPGFLTDTLIYQLLANIGSAVLNASDAIIGKVRLSFAALDLNTPIAVGDNDPIIRGIRRTYYLDQYGVTLNRTTLEAAIAAIGATPADLKITGTLSVTFSDVTIPSNIRVVFEGNGGVVLSHPRILTIGSMKDPGAYQIFFGTGKVVPPTSTRVRLDWYENSRNGLNAAINAIGATKADLVISSLVTISGDNITVPSNIRLVFEGLGGLTVDATRTVTIGAMKDPGAYQIFFGLGNVVLAAGAAPGGSIRLDWWATPGTGTDSTHAIAQIVLSQTNGNRKVTAGIGTWHFQNWDLSTFSQIEGSGMWDGNGIVNGTRFQYYLPPDTVADSGSYLLKMSDAFRAGTLRNLTLDLDDVEDVHAIVLAGNAPDSARCAFLAQRVAILGTAETVDQVLVNAIDDAWECTTIAFEDCLFTTGSNTRHFSINTVNSGPTWKRCEFFLGSGATAIYLGRTGYTQIADCQFGGAVGTDTTPTSRNVTGTVITNNVSGNNYLDIATGGAWQEGDIGQKVIRNGATLYITGLELVAGVASRAHLMSDPAADATQRTSAVYRFAPNTSKAYTAIHVAGSHATIDVINCVDEGFQYFAVHEGLQFEFPLNLIGNSVQSRILINNSCNINSTGNNYFSQTLIDGNPGQLSRIVSNGDHVSPTSINLYNGIPVIVLDEAQLFGGDRGEGTHIQTADSFFTGLLKSVRELPLQILDRSTSGTAGLPVLSIASARIIGSGLASAIQPLLEFGRLHPTTKKVDYWYRAGYQYMTGLLYFTSNMWATYKGYRFDGRIIAPAFQTEIVVGGSISEHTDNMSIGTTGGVVTLDSSGWYNITGFALPSNPSDPAFTYDLSAWEGAKIEFVYVGIHGVMLKHQDAGSSVVNRLNCDWQDDIALGPQDRAVAVYRNGKWNVSLLSRAPQAYQLITQIDLTLNSTTLQNTTLLGQVKPGYYKVEASILTTSGGGGTKVALGGGTFSSANFRGTWFAAESSDTKGTDVTSPATTFSDATFDGKNVRYKFEGSLQVATPGTLIVQAAQRASHASQTSILPGSTLELTPMKWVGGV